MRLDRYEWELGEPIGRGGFGAVYAAHSDSYPSAVAKLVPKEPGADRELLFVDLHDVRNVIPIIDCGDHDDHWILVMPRADVSLRQYIQPNNGPLETVHAAAILADIATALVDLDGRVVHRDIKPENVLLLDGRWCLADFGISRYAEAATAPDTRKYAMSPAYAAPERWRNERATIATDVYSLGIIAYELFCGSRPFNGTVYELREHHLHGDPGHLTHLPASLASLVDECLYKAPEARPSPANVLARLERFVEAPLSTGLAKLQEANRAEVIRRGEAARRESEFRTEAERRKALAEAADRGMARIASSLKEAITEAAPAVRFDPRAVGQNGWAMRLGEAKLMYISPLSVPEQVLSEARVSLPFDVIAHASIVLRFPPDRTTYEGRGHSLWYCDAHQAGQYDWFETAFMFSAIVPALRAINPFPLDPYKEDAIRALNPGVSKVHVAWPFIALNAGDLDEFICRWAEWFADASQGRLTFPSSMPERPVDGSWRRG